MAIAISLGQFLDAHHVPYDVLLHERTMTARSTARICEIEAGQLAKAVLMRDREGYVMAVLPASCRLDKAQLWRLLHRPMEFAEEAELQILFRDCDLGAIPALGPAYGIETIVDERLDRAAEVWLEAGDHESSRASVRRAVPRAHGRRTARQLRPRLTVAPLARPCSGARRRQDAAMQQPTIQPGRPFPLGVTLGPDGANVAVFSAHAERIELCLLDPAGERETARLPLPEVTDGVFHGFVPGLVPGQLYGFRAFGPWAPERGQRFNPHRLLLDPYARAVTGKFVWAGPNLVDRDDPLAFDPRDSIGLVPKGVMLQPGPPAPGERPARLGSTRSSTRRTCAA